MSHEMLHHVEFRIFFELLHMIWFQFETSFEFELKTLGKINKKAIKNSLENRKANSAQVGPLSPAPPARPRALGA
jgi:hypothetical protein